MDSCYISYIFSGKTGHREYFTKELSSQLIANEIRKNVNKYIILFRFNKEKEIVLTFWMPYYYKIADLAYPSWYQSLKTMNKNSIVITPRGIFKLSKIDNKFVEYCKKINKSKIK